jgi:uncharacterized membrane protein
VSTGTILVVAGEFVVGLLLTSFGCFWGAEGAGVDWPGDVPVTDGAGA